MNHSTLLNEGSSNGGIYIDYGPKGSIVKDKSGYHHKFIPPDEDDSSVARVLELFQSEVDDFFDKLSRAEDRLPEQLSITFHFRVRENWGFLTNSHLTDFLYSLCESRFICVILHFDSPPASWKLVLSPFVSALAKPMQTRMLNISLSGAFSKSPQEEMEFLFTHNFNLRHVGQSIQNVAKDQDVLFHFADFGFRIPIIWYIDSSNIEHIGKRVIEDCLYYNYNSGFGLPSIQTSPFFSPDNLCGLPPYSDYVGLLADVYKNYPYYDDVLLPVNHIANLCTNNGYSRYHNCTRNISLLVDSSQGLSLFGHSPFLATRWLSWESFGALAKGDMFLRLIQDYSHYQDNCRAEKCNECKWKHVCGGEFAGNEYNIDPSIDYCRLLDFFFRVFVWQHVQVELALK